MQNHTCVTRTACKKSAWAGTGGARLMKNEENKTSGTEAAGYIVGLGVGASRSVLRGKHISAAIVVLAGAILLLGGSYIRHSDTKLFVQIVGCIVGAIGLYGWFVSVTDK